MIMGVDVASIVTMATRMMRVTKLRVTVGRIFMKSTRTSISTSIYVVMSSL